MARDPIGVVRFQEDPFEPVVDPLLPPTFDETLDADLDVVVAVHQIEAVIAIHQTDPLAVSAALLNELVPRCHLQTGETRHLILVFELGVLLPHVIHHHPHIAGNGHPNLSCGISSASTRNWHRAAYKHIIIRVRRNWPFKKLTPT